MAAERGVDGDICCNRRVLRQVADCDRLAAAEIVDGGEVALADTVSNRADMRIDGDATVEERLVAFLVTDFADQLDMDLDRYHALVVPLLDRRFDAIDETDRADAAEVDRDHPAD